MKESLTTVYGDALAYKVVKSFIESPENFVDVEGFVQPEMFEDAGFGLDVLVKEIKEFYKEKGFAPGYADLEYYVKDRIKDKGERNSAYQAFTKVKDNKLLDGIDTASEVGVNYLKKIEAVRQLKNAKASVEKSGYDTDRIARIIEGLQGIENGHSEEWTTPGDMLEEVLDEGMEEKVATGLKELDEHLSGGIPKKTTNLLLAGTGVGKTTLFSIMACEAALRGNKVLYLYFEDKNTDFNRKFYAHVTGRYTNHFYKGSPGYEEASEQIRNKMKDERIKNAFHNIKQVKLPNGDTTVDKIKTVVRKLIIGGWRPDVVFLDYLQCIKSSTDGKLSIKDEAATMDRAMKRLDAFAQEEDFLLWVAQQFNREGCRFDSTYNRLGSIQGSFRVTQTASVILCLLKNNEDNEDFNRVNLYLDKSRYSSLCEWENSYLNNGTCQIALNPDTFVAFEDTPCSKPESLLDDLGL